MTGSAWKRGLLRVLLGLVQRSDWLAARVNRWLIDRICRVCRTRPHPWSTVHDYTSWAGLTDKTWSARHLPAVDTPDLPPPAQLVALFRRLQGGAQRLCGKSTCLFPAFAQYLTDGFIRTEMSQGPDDLDKLKRNTSNHNIDLCPLYGRTQEQTRALRTLSERPGERGRLKSQMLDQEEYAPFLYRDGRVDPQFAVLDPPLGVGGLKDDPGRRDVLFAFGGDRANAVPQVAMVNTLLLREHNRLAGEIERRHPDWDDTRVFETARNVVIVLFIKLVVEEYINHIAPTPFRLRADPSGAWNASWNKPVWITTEFSLLYRWHALIPDRITWGGRDYGVGETFLDNRPLLAGGLRQAFCDISATPAARLGLFNTTERLLAVEAKSIQQGRVCRLAPYADYRAYVGLKRPQRFEDVSSDPAVVQALQAAYGSVDRIDLYVGLFAEDRTINSPLPPLILRMVAVDAFSQALTNPLLSEHVFREETFSPYGWQTIHATGSLRDLVARNTAGPIGEAFIAMTLPQWRFV